MERSADRKSERSFAPLLVLAAIVLFLLPLLYVLSIGPVVWFVTSGRLPVGPSSPIAKFYAPLEMLCERSPMAEKVIGGYAEFWRADRPTPPPAPWSSAPPASTASPQAATPPTPSDVPEPASD